MSFIKVRIGTRSVVYRIVFGFLLAALVSACSSDSDPSDTSPVGDLPDATNTAPGEVPVIIAPIVEPPVTEFTPPAGQTQDIVDLLSATGTFTRLLALVEKAGLQANLQGSETVTLFAPDDDAFAALDAAVGAGSLDALDTEELRDRLNYHLVPGVALDSTALRLLDNKALLMGNELPAAINVDSGGDLLINSSALSAPDMLASNGILHVVDNVLTPPVRPVDPNDAVPPPTTDSISVTLLERSDYSILLDLIERAGLAELLIENNDGAGWTLFAPSDSAFERGSEDVFELDSVGASDLINLHLYSGTVTSAELPDGPLEMVEGTVQIERTAAGVTVGGATIVGRDRIVGNGIIHFVSAPLVAIGN